MSLSEFEEGGENYSDYFIHHRFRQIVRLYFLYYSDNSIIRQVGFSDVFSPIAKVIKINTVLFNS
jgi:hypothetical protein